MGLFLLILSVVCICTFHTIKTLKECDNIKKSSPPPYPSIKSRHLNIQDQFFNSDNSKSGNDDV